MYAFGRLGRVLLYARGWRTRDESLRESAGEANTGLANIMPTYLSLQDPGNEACLTITLVASILFRGPFVLKLNEV